jgi:hypothetical protein
MIGVFTRALVVLLRPVVPQSIAKNLQEHLSGMGTSAIWKAT